MTLSLTNTVQKITNRQNAKQKLSVVIISLMCCYQHSDESHILLNVPHFCILIGSMMNSVAVFVLVILATTQARLMQYNCSNSNMYIQATAASGMEDFQELQYCLIDKCTIMKIDTGQQLDIVYTSQSHFVVTPTDGQMAKPLCSFPRMSLNIFASVLLTILVSPQQLW